MSQSLQAPPVQSDSTPRKGRAFWLSFVGIVVSVFLSALDLTAVATALPTITNQLHGSDDFVWVGSAYALASTALVPLSGGLADIFGRKPIMLVSLLFFALGSALAGSAQNMNMMIAARTIQGIGGGGIMNLPEIIVADLVPLADRGVYQGIIGLTWSFASGIGPPIGGAFSENVSWRWLFYLNLPLAGLSFVLVSLFLTVRTPEGSIKDKFARVDWLGNAIVIVGTTVAIIGLTWAGIRFPWDSAQVLALLIIGLVLIGVFIVYEAKVPSEPTMPLEVLSNRTSLSAYIATMVHGITSISIIYYLPVYFQAALGASPIRSGVDLLPTAFFIALGSLICGTLVKFTGKYMLANVIGWVLTIVGFGLLSLLRQNSSVGQWVGFQVVVVAGTGVIYAATIFPVLAPLPVSRNAVALAFYSFSRAFAQTWGITISATILQNDLKKTLPADFIAQFPEGLEIAFAAIPKIPGLAEPLRTQVRVAFADSMSVVWKTMVGISGLGIVTLLFLKEVPMNGQTDENFGLVDKTKPAGASDTSVETVQV